MFWDTQPPLCAAPAPAKIPPDPMVCVRSSRARSVRAVEHRNSRLIDQCSTVGHTVGHWFDGELRRAAERRAGRLALVTLDERNSATSGQA